jgi:ankyrin repeat protein
LIELIKTLSIRDPVGSHGIDFRVGLGLASDVSISLSGNTMDRSVLLNLFSTGDWETHFESCLDEGLDINQQSYNDGWSLIHFAIDAENYTAVEWLCSRGADVNAVDDAGNSALHYAIPGDIELYRDLDMPVEFQATRVLLTLGADTSLKNKQGITPHDLVEQYGKEYVDQFDKMFAGIKN